MYNVFQFKYNNNIILTKLNKMLMLIYYCINSIVTITFLYIIIHTYIHTYMHT